MAQARPGQAALSTDTPESHSEVGPAPDTALRLERAARETFAEIGYTATRVEDIVTRAAVSHGTFYTYFTNKSAVLDALVQRSALRLEAVAAEPWEGADVSQTLLRVIGDFVDAYVEEADVVRAWIEATSHERHFGELLVDLRHGYVAKVADHVAPLVADQRHDPRVAASALVAMVEGYVTERLQPGVDEQARDSAVATLAAIWHGGLMALGSKAER